MTTGPLFELLQKKSVLLVVDMQNDFCSPNGVFSKNGKPILGQQRVVKPIQRLILEARSRKVPIVFTKLVYDLKKLPTIHKSRMKTKGTVGLCSPKSNGIEFYKVFPKKMDFVVEKNYYSVFYKTCFGGWLRKRKIQNIILAGVTTHVCPLLTAADAYYRGYRLIAVEDALGTYEGQEWALRYMKEQFAAIVCSSTELIRSWATG